VRPSPFILESRRPTFVCSYRQNELKEGAQRSVGKQYYYIDCKHFCNVVKWRVARMHSIIDSTLRNELDNKGYVCPQCHKSYSALDVLGLADNTRGAFICQDCRAELVDNENAENVKGSQDRMQRFNKQLRFIMKGLQASESMVIPAQVTSP
jgi:transcription initiation factor TFIIE subunit alpha